MTPNRVIRTDPRVNCREVSTRSRPLLLGISLVNGERSVGEAIISGCRFVGIDSANPELSHEPLSTNITMSDPHSANTNALIA